MNHEGIIFLYYQFQAGEEDGQQVDERIANNRRLRKPTEKMIQTAVSDDQNEPNKQELQKERVNSTLHRNYMLNYICAHIMLFFVFYS